MQFIEESWKAAFRLLSEGIDQKSQGVKIAHIESWTSSKISLLNEESSRLFNRISNGSDVFPILCRLRIISRSETLSVEENLTISQPYWTIRQPWFLWLSRTFIDFIWTETSSKYFKNHCFHLKAATEMTDPRLAPEKNPATNVLVFSQKT